MANMFMGGTLNYVVRDRIVTILLLPLIMYLPEVCVSFGIHRRFVFPFGILCFLRDPLEVCVYLGNHYGWVGLINYSLDDNSCFVKVCMSH